MGTREGNTGTGWVRPRDRAVAELRRALRHGGHPPRIVIIGAGAGGLCMGAQLKRAGVDTFTIHESGGGVGGTWRDNSYPGSGCDVPSHLYSFSFAPEAGWTRKFARQPEILRYFESLVERFDLGPHLHLGQAVASAAWSATTCTWLVTMEDGSEIEADIVVSGTGQLNRPRTPDIEGADTFGGTMFHSARWNHEHSVEGERVGVVGNAASAIQFVPEIAPIVDRLTIFQRTSNWVLPKPDREYAAWERRLYRRLPIALQASRLRIFLRLEANFRLMRKGSWLGRLLSGTASKELRKMASPELPEEALVPDFAPGCKRILISNDWYATLLRKNVEVELDPIAQIEPTGIVTRSGRRHELDTIIFATGFETTGFLVPMQVTGVDGQDLHDTWGSTPRAHLGICVSGFPNLFMLYGPNTNLGHNSILFMIEGQVDYTLQCIAEIVREGSSALDVQPEAMERSLARIDDELESTVWAGNCGSWYKTAGGVVTNNWSSYATAYRNRVRHPDFGDFRRLQAEARSSNTMMLPE